MLGCQPTVVFLCQIPVRQYGPVTLMYIEYKEINALVVVVVVKAKLENIFIFCN